MTATAEQIVAHYLRRKTDLALVQAKRLQVRDAYNGEMRVALPDMGRNERAAVANLLNTGLDQMAMRVSSTLPSIFCPPRDEAVKREVTAAEKRKRALYGWWEANDFEMMIPRRARQMLAYAQSPVMLWPDFKRGIPAWRMRDPLGTYPAACLNPGDMTPPDCIFAYQQTLGWVKHHYPEQYVQLYRKETCRRDEKVTLLDYVDDRELVTVVLGQVADTEVLSSSYTTGFNYNATPGFVGGNRYLVLERLENILGF